MPAVSIKRCAANPSLPSCAAAKLCLEREETDQANEYVKRSLAANPKDGYALLIKGQLALQMGQFYVRKHAMKGGDKAAAKCAGLPRLLMAPAGWLSSLLSCFMACFQCARLSSAGAAGGIVAMH